MTQIEILKLQQDNVGLNITIIDQRTRIDAMVRERLVEAGTQLQRVIEAEAKKEAEAKLAAEAQAAIDAAKTE